MTNEEILEREVATLYTLLTTASWLLEGMVDFSNGDPATYIENERDAIELFLESSSTVLSSLTDQYMKITQAISSPSEGAVAVWVKGKGLAVDVAYYCARCKHEQSCEMEGKRMKHNTIEHCWERKLTVRDN